MANTVRNQPGTERISTIEETNPLETFQDKYEQNKKRINTGITVVLLVVAGFFGYQKLIKEPKETKASSAIAYAQTYFAQDSVNKALNGDGQHQGFLQIIKKYGSTKAGNLAHYYAGICYLQMNDPKNAIKHLKEFDANGTNVEYVAFGALGDAYMETNNVKEGIEYYNKAAGNKSDNLLTPIYLYRAAMAYEMNNQADKAKENYKRIRDEYPQSMQAREIDKNLARLGVLD
jgi:tetratricopeptide (TPR) repeat protein